MIMIWSTPLVSKNTPPNGPGGNRYPPSPNCNTVHNPENGSPGAPSPQGESEIFVPKTTLCPQTPYSPFGRIKQRVSLPDCLSKKNCCDNVLIHFEGLPCPEKNLSSKISYDNDLIQFEGLPFREIFLSSKTCYDHDLIQFEVLPFREKFFKQQKFAMIMVWSSSKGFHFGEKILSSKICYANDLIQFEGLPFREKFFKQQKFAMIMIWSSSKGFHFGEKFF